MIVTTPEAIIALQKDASIVSVLKHPVACVCGRMAAFVVNRDGKTRCLVCDDLYQKGQAK